MTRFSKRTAELVWDVRASLGEGPVWLPAERAVRFVDIKGGHLHRYVLGSGKKETLDVGGKPSFVLPSSDGGLVVGSESSVYALDDEALGRRIVTVEQPAHNRTNDGTVDCFGRLWFGTMDDEERQTTGRVYCLDRGRLNELGCDAVVTNGPAVSADGRTLYHVDSGRRVIWRYVIGDGPRLEGGAVFLQLTEADGYPDGVVLDSEGCLWVALWDGWCVRRYAPDGRLLLQIDVPCARVTKVAFGGDGLRTVFVTTARVGLSDAQLAAQPFAGGLFAFDAPAPGVAMPAVRLGA